MSIAVSRTGATVTLLIGERLELSCQQEFQRAYEGSAGVSEYIVNLSETQYIDSSALGMLLLLREACPPSVVIRIIHCRPGVRKTLMSANLQRMFSIA
jgi:HptB-dependent secretion and biofilm anti anti-sigma factor